MSQKLRVVQLTSSSRGSLVTRCMGRMRKEIMGRPPHSVLPSICFRVSLNRVLLVLADGNKEVRSQLILPLRLLQFTAATHNSFCRVLCWKVSLEQ